MGPRVIDTFRLLRHSRVAVAMLIVYQSLFLNVFVPSHTPTVVTVDGSPTAHACCHGGDESESRKTRDDNAPEPDRSRCAVCHLVARLAPAAAFDLKLPEHGLLEVLPLLPPHVASSATPAPPYLGRGPPATDRPAVA